MFQLFFRAYELKRYASYLKRRHRFGNGMFSGWNPHLDAGHSVLTKSQVLDNLRLIFPRMSASEVRDLVGTGNLSLNKLNKLLLEGGNMQVSWIWSILPGPEVHSVPEICHLSWSLLSYMYRTYRVQVEQSWDDVYACISCNTSPCILRVITWAWKPQGWALTS